MSGSANSSALQLNDCGGCEGLAAGTPVDIDNRAGLGAIAYRVGTHADFLRSMLAKLSSQGLPALANLRTRDPDDFSIALLDAWATAADVLTFYQERIANESFLRTATERRSLQDQARLIGYELRPGVAASTFLAFTLEEAPGSPRRTTIHQGAKVQSIPGPGEKPQTYETLEPFEARVEWNTLRPVLSEFVNPQFGSTFVYLKGTTTNLKRGDALLFVGSERETDSGSEHWDFRRVTEVVPDHEADRTRVEWAEGLGTSMPHVVQPAANPQVFALRLRASLFGYNAPHPATLSDETLTHYDIPSTKPIGDWPFAFSGQTIDLDTTYPAILKDSWLVLSSPDYQELYRAKLVTEAALAKYVIAGKTTRITTDTKENLSRFQNANYRGVMVFAQSELLEMAPAPIVEPINGERIPLAAMPQDLATGQWLAASGKDAATGDPISEVVAVLKNSGTTLVVTPPLVLTYDRSGFKLNANVVRASHGEAATEVLGTGDARRVFQRFELRQPPLTHVSASNSSGAESTLRVYVNDLQWQEVQSLYGRKPDERIFVTQTSDEGKTTVQFGDGRTGARLPSGQENVKATYRKGIGLDGLVKAGQLSLLMTRPLGLKSVVNPLPATGAANGESLNDARVNAPLTVLTLDRIVSLQDYENFARAYAGIAKSLATSMRERGTQGVFLTVAGPAGAEVELSSDLCRNLLKALANAGNPFVPIRLRSYRKAMFKVTGSFRVNPDRIPEKVKTAVDSALLRHFSFDERKFGQSVPKSEVIAVIQNVPGVSMVDIDDLRRTTGIDDSSVNDRLLAAMPDGDLAAELLTIDPAQLKELKVTA